MSRRTHRKSKYGCSDCKRRHIKCDESRPDCVNCATAQLRCSFITQSDDGLEVQSRTTQASSLEAQTTLPASPSPFQANGLHFDLLCHFFTEIWNDFQPRPVAVDASFRAVQKYIYTAPYLMHEILAVSALHLSIVRHEKCDFYRHPAEVLQHQALTLFNHQTPELNQMNCVPMFLFSSFLGLHLLCDTIVYRNGDLDSFLDSFVRYLRLHRGVRAITWGNWDFLRASELKEVIWPAAIQNSGSTPRTECQDLINLINQPHIDPATMSTYQSAVGLLQSLFNVNRERPAESCWSKEDPRLSSYWLILRCCYIVTAMSGFSVTVANSSSGRLPEHWAMNGGRGCHGQTWSWVGCQWKRDGAKALLK